ncbi:MAG: VCBS repeat-containing protein [Deferribacteres bacterium]|nr:VCBS repeat-containing protein [Deferribacteres bacterium]
MRRLHVALLTLVLVLIPVIQASGDAPAGTEPPGPAGEKVTPGISAEVNKARDLVLEYFLPSSGTVLRVGKGVARIRLEADKGIKKGMRFSVFRQGAPFYHPVTNEMIGRTDLTGTIEVRRKDGSDGSYLCTIIRGDIKRGDKVRITSSKIKLAFFQERKADWALSEAFYESLKGSGRFDILETYTATYEPAELSELAGRLGAEAFLILSTPVEDDTRFLDIRLYWTEDAKMFGEVKQPAAPRVVRMAGPDEEFIFSAAVDTEPWGEYALEGGRLIAMGDVDGNGRKEIVISDGADIRIYELKDDLRELWLIKGSPSEKHLSIDVLDLNNNGRAEIFVTSMTGRDSDSSLINSMGGWINSYVMEYDPSEGYVKIRTGMPYFLRVEGNALLMQKFAPYGIFSGPVYEGEWREGDYKPERPLALPAGVNIYGFTYADWRNNGRPGLVSFDDSGYLTLYDAGGDIIWKSKETYGRFDSGFKDRMRSTDDPDAKWYIRARLRSVHTERGQEVVVVRKVPVLSTMPGLGYRGAEVYSLWWDGAVMQENLILKEIPGTVTDYWIDGNRLFLVARGDLYSFVKNAFSGEFSKGGALYYYNLGKK